MASITLRTLANCDKFLWTPRGSSLISASARLMNAPENQKARRNVDHFITLFDSTFDWLRNETLRYVLVG